MKNWFPLALCFSSLLCASCSMMLKTAYQTPQVRFPVHWQQNSGGATPVPFTWHDFHDPELEQWLQQVLASNNDLAIAVLRIYRARLEAERVGTAAATDISGTLNTDTNMELTTPFSWNKSSATNFSTRYEADLWGKLARQRDAAGFASQATEQDLYAARLTLLANASINYWRTGFIYQQIGVMKQSVLYTKETLRLARARYRAGSISALDVVNAEQSLLIQENRLLALQHEGQQVLNERTLLLGAPPGSSVYPRRLPAQPLPQVNTGIPANVLNRRPDISAKALRLREALANVDIKRAEYYPAFNLTGSLGTSSTALLEFLRNPLGVVGTSLSLPFLEWRQVCLDVKIARNDYEQRVVEFRQALYKAMADVADALSLRDQLMAQEKHLRMALELARKSERLNRVRYQQGALPIIHWLDAQEQLRQAELALDENRFRQYQNLAKIYLEFGGDAA